MCRFDHSARSTSGAGDETPGPTTLGGRKRHSGRTSRGIDIPAPPAAPAARISSRVGTDRGQFGRDAIDWSSAGVQTPPNDRSIVIATIQGDGDAMPDARPPFLIDSVPTF